MMIVLRDIRVFCETRGSGEIPIVLIHGLGASHRLWLPQIDVFSQYFKTVYFDLRGHGLSEVPMSGYELHNYTEDLLALLDYLNIDKANLCGISMGGMIAMDFAVKYPEKTEKLVLAGTAPSITDVNKKIMNFLIKDSKAVEKARSRSVTAEKFIETMYSPEFLKSVSKELLESIKARISESPWLGYVEAVKAFVSSKWSVEEKLPQLENPTLIIHGKKDIVFDVTAAQKLSKLIKNSQLQIFDVGHVVNVEEPKLFNEKVLEFLKK